MKEVILFVEYGGLGDHLFFSPLPRLLKTKGIADKVFLSRKSPFRSQQIYDLVWKNNPYFDGMSDKDPSPKILPNSKIDKVINLIASSYEIIDIDSEISPEIYGLTIDPNSPSRKGNYIDLNYVSFVGAISILDKIKLLFRYKEFVVINPAWYLIPFVLRRFIRTISLLDYLSLIRNSSNFVCLASGGATLAAAVGKSAVVYYGYGQPSIFHHKSNTNIMMGSKNWFRINLCRILFKYNEIKKNFNKNK